MAKLISKIEAYDYRNRRLLVMPSGTTLIFKPQPDADPEHPAHARLIYEAPSLTAAQRWLDGN